MALGKNGFPIQVPIACTPSNLPIPFHSRRNSAHAQCSFQLLSRLPPPISDHTNTHVDNLEINLHACSVLGPNGGRHSGKVPNNNRKSFLLSSFSLLSFLYAHLTPPILIHPSSPHPRHSIHHFTISPFHHSAHPVDQLFSSFLVLPFIFPTLT